MKSLKKIIAIAITLTMVATLAIGMAASAATIIITPPARLVLDDNDFGAYQIFTVTTADGSNFSYTINPEFSGFNVAGFMTANGIASTAPYSPDLQGLLNYIGDLVAGATKDELMRALAIALKEYGDGDGITPNATEISGTLNGTNVQFAGLANGYYVVFGEGIAKGGDKVTSLCILVTVDDFNGDPAGTFTIPLKADAPEITKTVYNHGENDWIDWTDIGTSNIAEFKLDTMVPDMTGYDEYWFIIHDRMSAGLTFNDDIEVFLNGVLYPATAGAVTNYTITKPAGLTFMISFNPEVFVNLPYGAAIQVKYSATLNKNALIGPDDNPERNLNEAKLEYSNNPYDTGAGKTGETPWETVFVYTFDVDIFKYTGEDDTPVAEAQFLLQYNPTDNYYFDDFFLGDNYLFVVFEYEGLVGGVATYRAVSYDGLSGAVKTALGAMYASAKAGNQIAAPAVGDYTLILTSPAGGYVKVIGTDAGEYELIETYTPSQFNLLPAPIVVDVIHDSASDNPIVAGDMGVYHIEQDGDETDVVGVLNSSGTIFPGTGGIGRTIFIVVGLTVMTGAVITLIVRKSMAKTRKAYNN